MNQNETKSIQYKIVETTSFIFCSVVKIMNAMYFHFFRKATIKKTLKLIYYSHFES